jgi:hypothetical protein
VLNFAGNKNSANQNSTKISSHPSYNDHLQEQKTTNAGKDVVKQELLFTAGWKEN